MITQVVITKELRNFCEALLSLYEEVGDKNKDAELDWWHAYSDGIDVNVYVCEGIISVTAYYYTNGEMQTQTETPILKKVLRKNK